MLTLVFFDSNIHVAGLLGIAGAVVNGSRLPTLNFYASFPRLRDELKRMSDSEETRQRERAFETRNWKGIVKFVKENSRGDFLPGKVTLGYVGLKKRSVYDRDKNQTNWISQLTGRSVEATRCDSSYRETC